jgi:hypothetical protein
MSVVRVRFVAALAAVVMLLLPGCTQASKRGVVTGLLVEFGGPGPGVRLLVPGHVTAAGAAATETVLADRHGRFGFVLPPGVYQLTAQSGGARCGRVRPVRVRSGTVTRGANVTCSVP